MTHVGPARRRATPTTSSGTILDLHRKERDIPARRALLPGGIAPAERDSASIPMEVVACCPLVLQDLRP